MKKKMMMLAMALVMTVTSVLGGKMEARAEQAAGEPMAVQEAAAQPMESTDEAQHVTRVAGNDRYETAIRCAELMREKNGVDMF